MFNYCYHCKFDKLYILPYFNETCVVIIDIRSVMSAINVAMMCRM